MIFQKRIGDQPPAKGPLPPPRKATTPLSVRMGAPCPVAVVESQHGPPMGVAQDATARSRRWSRPFANIVDRHPYTTRNTCSQTLAAVGLRYCIRQAVVTQQSRVNPALTRPRPTQHANIVDTHPNPTPNTCHKTLGGVGLRRWVRCPTVTQQSRTNPALTRHKLTQHLHPTPNTRRSDTQLLGLAPNCWVRKTRANTGTSRKCWVPVGCPTQRLNPRQYWGNCQVLGVGLGVMQKKRDTSARSRAHDAVAGLGCRHRQTILNATRPAEHTPIQPPPLLLRATRRAGLAERVGGVTGGHGQNWGWRKNFSTLNLGTAKTAKTPFWQFWQCRS